MRASARHRRIWLTLHLWLGVGLLAAFAPLAVSGALLVWQAPLSRALYPDRFAVSGPRASLTLSDYGRIARGAMGERARFNQLRLPQAARDPVIATGMVAGPPGETGRPRFLTVWIDPPTGKVLAVADAADGLISFIHRLHGSLLIAAPGVGRQIVGWLGWAMFASAATGLWLWWPRDGAVLRALRWRRGTSGLFNLHHMVGFWVCVPLAMLALSGVYIAFPAASHAIVGAPAPPAVAAGGAARRSSPLARPVLSLDAAAAAALALHPGSTVSQITAPTRGRAPAWRVQLSAGSAGGAIAVRVDDASGAARLDDDTVPDPVSRLIRRVHDGEGMGAVWRVILVLTGLAPPVLGVTGALMWLRRRPAGSRD